ncbi:cellulose biosynthesis protein BcsG [Sphaerotilus mobilis]|uniref:Cellulose synthase operon protein YhjU n=1 Tax=Sphaerotilus mobilis TaxID=47994 RepID=A0A4Q7LT60_9BURK|nr:cellulose biosynthesis protein BcsG [Sphaerotilus mobilis]RZS57834.1 cellulose synthase operon protein YhjU [Sphaerotilus mobilis]
MGAWSIYFLLKFGLHLSGLIELALLANVALALLLSWPWPGGLHRLLRWLAVPAGAALLYRESPWPPLSRLWDNWQAVSDFSLAYLFELGTRFVNAPMLAALLVAGVVLSGLATRLRLSTWVFVGLAVFALLPSPAQRARDEQLAQAVSVDGAGMGPIDLERLDLTLQAFHDGERAKTLKFPVDAGPPPFDLVILSVCSLSWDDLDHAKLTDAPFMRRFDVVFDRFNSGATYSGPAVLRLLHANCGQVPQSELYGGARGECLLMRSLEQAGYQPAVLLNHDGRFDGFADTLKRDSALPSLPEQVLDAPVAMNGFDGSAIRDDGEVLGRWWRARAEAAGPGRLALLYNTISLHDGNRVPGIASISSLDTYAPRARKLFADLERFVDGIERSGRPTVVVLAPEHGAAVRGDAQQVAGLRELPTRVITHVPAGVMLLNFGVKRAADAPPVHVTQNASYQSLFAVVAGLLHGGPEVTQPERLVELGMALPPIEWVSENDRHIYLQRGPYGYLRTPEGRWSLMTAQP